MTPRSIERARSGDFAGMNFAGLVRLSFETDDDATDPHPMTGKDIKGRNEQTLDCKSYVERRGGTYIHTYEEPNTSAYKRRPVQLPDGRTVYRVIRPIFEAALADLKHGATSGGQRLDGLVVYDIDRLTRDPRNLEDAIEVVEHFGKPIIDITGSLDLLTDNGRTMARVIVATANKSSADTARRVRRKHQAMQQKGIPAGGTRPYGWQDDRRTLNEAEADNVREAVRRFLGGAPLTGIAADWNRRGILTRTGKTWTASALKVVFKNPRICGYRGRIIRNADPITGRVTRRMETVLDANGDPVIGQWEPIISIEDWGAIMALLESNRKPGFGDNARKYRLSGILRCGMPGCGTKMRGSPRVEKGEATYYYQCPATGLGGCGGVAINGPKADEWIIEAVIAKFEFEAAKRSTETLPEAWPGTHELAEVQQQIADLTAGWRARPQLISTARYFGLLPELERDEQELIAQRDAWSARRASIANQPLSIRKDWESGRLTLAEQRAYIERVLVAVMVAPIQGARGIWNPDRMTPVWRTPS